MKIPSPFLLKFQIVQNVFLRPHFQILIMTAAKSEYHLLMGTQKR